MGRGEPVLFYYNQRVGARQVALPPLEASQTRMQDTILVTGGAGFIGSNFILQQMQEDVRLDRQSRQADLRWQSDTIWRASRRIRAIRSFTATLATAISLSRLLGKHQPRAIVHFAAESHVDRSIRGPEDFIRTNVDGTFALLEEVRDYWERSADEDRKNFRFLHVSTDEVLRLARARRSAVLRDHALCAEQSVCRVEGGDRSSGARLSSHLRLADADHELLEQLRAVSSFRKS